MRKEKLFFFSYPSKTSLIRMANHTPAPPQKVAANKAKLIQIEVDLLEVLHLIF